jgi:phosphohistidine phosphatase
MNIYLIRHGKAEPTSSLVDDKERQLTDEGKKILRSSAEQWKSIIKQPDFILTSPLIRAVQTAEIIAEVMNFNDGVLNENLLLPGSSTNSLIELSKSLNAENIFFVAHQPDLSFHLSRFIGNTEVNLKFSPGSIAKISFEGKPKLGKGMLAFLLPPVTI